MAEKEKTLEDRPREGEAEKEKTLDRIRRREKRERIDEEIPERDQPRTGKRTTRDTLPPPPPKDDGDDSN